MNKSLSSYNNCSSAEELLLEMDRNGYKCQKQTKGVKLYDSRGRKPYTSTIKSLRAPYKPFHSAVGLIRVNWRNQKRQLTSINYGTGFAVNKKYIVTCAHNIISQRQGEVAEEILFIPGIDGIITDETLIYRCSNKQNIKYRKAKKSYSWMPLEEQVALFKLDDGQQINSETFIKVGSLEDQIKDKSLQVVGYPSEDFNKKININQVRAEKVALEGQLYSIDRHIINHTIRTSVGHSGSPIIAKDKNGSFYAVGIHTHRGVRPDFNSGLYFNQSIIQTLQRFEQQLSNQSSITKETSIFKDGLLVMKSKFPLPCQDEFFKGFDLNIDNRDSIQNLQKSQYQEIYSTQVIETHVVELNSFQKEQQLTVNESEMENSALAFDCSKKSTLSQQSPCKKDEDSDETQIFQSLHEQYHMKYEESAQLGDSNICIQIGIEEINSIIDRKKYSS